MKFDQDLCLNFSYELNPRVQCAFGNVCILGADHASNNDYLERVREAVSAEIYDQVKTL